MPTTKKRVNFFASEEGVAIKQALQTMATDSAYNTMSRYSTNQELYPDHLISFVDRHMNYLNAHPSVNPDQYVSNLRLMTRIR